MQFTFFKALSGSYLEIIGGGSKSTSESVTWEVGKMLVVWSRVVLGMLEGHGVF